MEKIIKISGAGISGMTAALNLAEAGFGVEIYEANDTAGKRFYGDLQGIENWSFEQDTIEFLKEIKIEINFDYHGFKKIFVWGPDNYNKDFTTNRPAFYLVKRGREIGCLDYGLQQQVKNNKNIKILYNRPMKPEEVDIVATGPVMNDLIVYAFASGYTFNTNLDDLAISILDDKYAKDGYSYFLVNNHYGVISTFIFKNFKKLNKYRERTVELCQKNLNFSMTDMKKFSGIVNFFFNKDFSKIYIGEAGGIQDYLWGFGMRYALLSGYLAAQSIINKTDYYKLYNKVILPKLKTSIANRLIFKLLGKTGYKMFINYFAKTDDPLAFLRRFYNPSPLKSAIYPFAKWHFGKHLADPK